MAKIEYKLSIQLGRGISDVNGPRASSCAFVSTDSGSLRLTDRAGSDLTGIGCGLFSIVFTGFGAWVSLFPNSPAFGESTLLDVQHTWIPILCAAFCIFLGVTAVLSFTKTHELEVFSNGTLRVTRIYLWAIRISRVADDLTPATKVGFHSRVLGDAILSSLWLDLDERRKVSIFRFCDPASLQEEVASQLATMTSLIAETTGATESR